MQLPIGCASPPDPPLLALVELLPNSNGVDDFVLVFGEPGAACTPCDVWVANLDTDEAPMAHFVAADGSFLLEPLGREGDVLRLQTIAGETRSRPLDLGVAVGTPIEIAIANPCLHIAAQIDLGDVGAGSARSIEMENACDEAIEIDSLSLRGASPITFITQAPLSIESGARAAIEIEFSSGITGVIEDIVFVSVALPIAERRAITLIARSIE